MIKLNWIGTEIVFGIRGLQLLNKINIHYKIHHLVPAHNRYL